MKTNKNKKILFILVFILFLISNKNIYADYGVYGYSGTTVTCFASQDLCKEDATTKNLPVTMCVKISDIDVDVKCPNFSKKTTPITTDKPFYFSDESGIVIGETYADLPACTTAYNTYKTAHPNATINPCKNAQTPAQTVTKTVNYINALKQQPTMDTVYTLLAPIGKLVTAPTNIGDYFNILLEIAIGLCAVLAVIMIVIGGIQYMGDESIFGKTEAKGQITKAILGLLIALGAFALLNTIDPALLGKNGVNVKSVSIAIEPLYDRGANDPKNANGESVRCTPVTTANSPCTVAKLTPIFGAENAVAMSKICNMESSGRVGTISSTDYCMPGKYPDTSFSYGLFQVNLSANGSLASSDCVGIFDRVVAGRDAIEPKYNNGFNCKILPGKENLFKKCRGLLLDTTKNLEIAKKLFTPDKGAWVGDKMYCASAFQ